jgi:hypothetical protein
MNAIESRSRGVGRPEAVVLHRPGLRCPHDAGTAARALYSDIPNLSRDREYDQLRASLRATLSSRYATSSPLSGDDLVRHTLIDRICKQEGAAVGAPAAI